MIQNELNRKPVISFGLGVFETTIALGDSVTIFQNEIYNTETFELIFNLMAKNVYQFDYTPTLTGDYDLKVNLVTKDGKINMESNTIILHVI